MYPSGEPLNFELQQKLAVFKLVPERNAQAAALGRTKFLAQVEAMAQSPIPAASQAARRRQDGRGNPLGLVFSRKAAPTILNSLAVLLLVVLLLVGGAAGTTLAAQNSLPGQALYSVKTLGEDVSLMVASNVQEQIALALQYANRRVAEMETITQKGRPVPEAALERLQINVDYSLHLAASLDDVHLSQALESIQQALLAEDAMLQAVQPGSGQNTAALTRARHLLQARLNWTEAGLTDPEAFRRHFGPGGEGAAGQPPQLPTRQSQSAPTATPDISPTSSATSPTVPAASGNDSRQPLQTPAQDGAYGPGMGGIGPQITPAATGGQSVGPGSSGSNAGGSGKGSGSDAGGSNSGSGNGSGGDAGDSDGGSGNGSGNDTGGSDDGSGNGSGSDAGGANGGSGNGSGGSGGH